MINGHAMCQVAHTTHALQLVRLSESGHCPVRRGGEVAWGCVGVAARALAA